MNTSGFFRSVVFLSLASLCLALPLVAAKAKPAPEPVEETYALPKFEVRGNAICSFGIGIAATWNAKTQSIGHVYVTSVNEGSAAERANLKAGDEILSINGRKISDMKGGLKRNSDLFELLVNRPAGELIDVEVAVRTVKKVVLTATPY